MSKRRVSIATIAKRMDRILEAYRTTITDENENQAMATSSRKPSRRVPYSTRVGLEYHDDIVNYAASEPKPKKIVTNDETPVSHRTRSTYSTRRTSSRIANASPKIDKRGNNVGIRSAKKVTNKEAKTDKKSKRAEEDAKTKIDSADTAPIVQD